MGERKGPVVWLLVTVALLASSAGVGCGSEPLDLTADQARGLILQQFPEADPIVISVTVEEQRASAQTEFNGEIVDFLFAADEAGWLLEGVEHKGQVYFIEDLEYISRSMVLMNELATALASYYEDHGSYPVGEGPQAREVMVPDYLDGFFRSRPGSGHPRRSDSAQWRVRFPRGKSRRIAAALTRWHASLALARFTTR